MPTPKPHVATDGTTTYKVRIRVHGRQTSETFDSKSAALAFCADVEEHGAAYAVEKRARSDAQDETYIPTVAEALDQHLNELTGVEDRTIRDYRREADRSWLPIIGHLPVDAVTRTDIARWINNDDRARKTLANANSLLSSVYETAIRNGHVGLNPARGTRLPRNGEGDDDIRFLTYDEFDLLYGLCDPDWRPFLRLLVGTGLRFSEATALQVQDIDLRGAYGPTVRVVRAWKDQDRKIGPPKSRASRRTIVLPREVVEELAPRLKRAGSSWLFTTQDGEHIRHNNFYARIWRPLVLKASICKEHRHPECKCFNTKHEKCMVHVEKNAKGHKVFPSPCECEGTLSPRPRIHDLRHTHASWLLAQGVRLEVIQERLGHQDYMTTRRIYAHLMPDMQRDAAIAASAAFAATRSPAALH